MTKSQSRKTKDLSLLIIGPNINLSENENLFMLCTFFSMLCYHKVTRSKGFSLALAVFGVFDRIINIERTDVTSLF